MRRLAFLFLMLSLVLSPSVLARQGHMKLLAVKETDSGYEGGIADLYLEIKPGSGRVFLETFPLTRTDTQMSTRFAKAIACDALERDCDDTDFFYTITADSAIIAGPSAGSSIAILTVAMLKNLELNENYASTGTINSGGLIGPVGGLKAKIEAAKKAGLKKVFIPAGELIIRIDNSTVDLKNLSKELGIEIFEVSALSEAVKEFTGEERTIILYESPHRVLKALDDIVAIMPQARLVCVREATKMFEEVIRGKPEEVLLHFQNHAPKGEFVILISQKEAKG